MIMMVMKAMEIEMEMEPQEQKTSAVSGEMYCYYHPLSVSTF